MKELAIRRLKKLHALAERGEGHESKTAKEMFDNLLIKHELTMEDILDIEKTISRMYKYRTRQDKELLFQTFFKVTNKSECNYKIEKRNQYVWFELTPAEHIQLAEEYEIYRKAWKEHQEKALMAFIVSNDIVGTSDEKSDKEITPEEQARWDEIFEMATNIKPTPVNKALV